MRGQDRHTSWSVQPVLSEKVTLMWDLAIPLPVGAEVLNGRGSAEAVCRTAGRILAPSMSQRGNVFRREQTV
jgi:hypothetical protein